MFELLLGIAVIGSIVAGIWDLLTTEVPDEIPALMITSGLALLLVDAASTGNFSPLFTSMIAGTILLLAGLLIYKKGGWGAADAWILAALGYIIPFYNNRIFMIDYIFNFFLVAVAYMIVYALALGFRNRKIFSYLCKELGTRWKVVAGVPITFSIAVVVMLLYSNVFDVLYASLYILLIAGLMIFWVYAKVIEKYEFKKRIPVSRLKVGDVLEDMLWRGITKEELTKIRKEKKFVVIKEGVRFVPVFPITLVVTLLYGSLLFVL